MGSLTPLSVLIPHPTTPTPILMFLLNTYYVVRDVLSFLGQKGSLLQGAESLWQALDDACFTASL